MRDMFGGLAAGAVLVFASSTLLARVPEIDDDLMASRRLFPDIGPGLRALRHSANGNYYVCASPVGVAVFDAKGRQILVIGASSSPAPAANKAGRSTIGFEEDCDVDAQGNVYVADRANNQVVQFGPDGKQVRVFPVDGVLSLAVLPDGEVAVTAAQSAHPVTVYGAGGKIAREFGEIESLSSRADIDRFLNVGRVAADPQGHIYYGFTYMPEPLVRQFDRYGDAKLDFVFTGVDAYPEASATRKAISKQEANSEPPVFRAILTAFGVDPVSGDVWMGLHNTLVHFDKDGIRRSEYQIYTPKGVALDATVILVEEQRLLIGGDPIGIYEFRRPDRIR
jgi:hypothetical protein